MFGIGLPELIVIFIVALVVVGPEKLPGLAKSVAKQIFELKKAANALKSAIDEETKEKPWELLTGKAKEAVAEVKAAPRSDESRDTTTTAIPVPPPEPADSTATGDDDAGPGLTPHPGPPPS